MTLPPFEVEGCQDTKALERSPPVHYKKAFGTRWKLRESERWQPPRLAEEYKEASRTPCASRSKAC